MFDPELSRVALVRQLDPTSRRALVEVLEPRSVPRGGRIFTLGDEPTELYIVASGKVKLTRPSPRPLPSVMQRRGARPHIPAPRESLLWLNGPGDIFGELSIFDPGPRSTTATAMVPTELLVVYRDDLWDLIRNHQRIAEAFLQQLAGRIRRANDTMSGLVLSDVPGRLAFVLLSLAERFGTPTERGIEVRHDLTQAELAQMVGATRETVNKVLTDFVTKRWITVRARTIVVREPGKLRARID